MEGMNKSNNNKKKLQFIPPGCFGAGLAQADPLVPILESA